MIEVSGIRTQIRIRSIVRESKSADINWQTDDIKFSITVEYHHSKSCAFAHSAQNKLGKETALHFLFPLPFLLLLCRPTFHFISAPRSWSAIGMIPWSVCLPLRLSVSKCRSVLWLKDLFLHWKCLHEEMNCPRNTILQLSTTYADPSPSSSHLLNRRRCCHLANTLKHRVQANRRNFHVMNSHRQHVAQLFQTTPYTIVSLSLSATAELLVFLSRRLSVNSEQSCIIDM